MCDTPQRYRLVATYDQIYSRRWLHLTLAVNAMGDAYLQVRSGLHVIAQDTFVRDSESFYFVQTRVDAPTLCVGLCNDELKGAELGFVGHLREVYVSESFTKMQFMGSDQINNVRQYNSNLLGYYRLKNTREQFSDAEVILRGNKQFKNFFEAENAIDVCPWTNSIKRFISVDGKNTPIKPYEISMKLKEQDYGYTLSMTFMLESDHCYSKNVASAQADCNLVYLENVFMLYMTGPNKARFRFFAEKNYYQSQSPQFFLPYNQWITLQMTLDHYRGYLIVLMDTKGAVISTLKRQENMQRQSPGHQLQLLRGTACLVSSFLLVDESMSLPVRSSLLQEPLFDLDFSGDELLIIPNRGSEGPLQLLTPAMLVSTLFESFDDIEMSQASSYDGVTCNDLHKTVLINHGSPNLEIKLDSSPPKTLQFWFKFYDKSDFYAGKIPNSKTVFFQLKSFERVYEPLWEMYLHDEYTPVDSVGNYHIQRALKIAPFGSETILGKDTIIIFPEFTSYNEDEFGWWHISCSLRDNQSQCTLSNKNIEVKRTGFSQAKAVQELKSVSSAFFFSNLKQLMIKDVTMFSRVLSDDEVRFSRYHRGSFKESQMVETSFKNMTQLLVEDRMTKQVLEYLPGTKRLQLSTQKIYHAICPPMTYLQSDRCYSEPVNQLVLTVFPRYDSDVDDLIWRFSIEHSNFIAMSDDRRQTGLMLQLNSDDPTLDEILFYQSYQDPHRWYFDVQSRWMRHEGEYKLTAIVTNKNFYEQQQITFIPNKCHWFQIQNSDAWSANQTITSEPGLNDITFNLKRHSLPSVGCDRYFNFYNQFDAAGFNFKFLIANQDSEYFVEQPTIEWVPIYSEDKVNTIEGIEVSIPTYEQHKLPIWTDIKIIMKIEWQSAEFDSTAEGKDIVFQNLLYTFRFEPKSPQLDAQIVSNTQIVTSGQTLELHANTSTIKGVDADLIQKHLQFKWTCPVDFNDICKGQDTQPSLYLPYINVKNTVQITYDYKYRFDLLVTLDTPDGQTLQSQNWLFAKWYSETQTPTFEVTCTPEPISLLSAETTRCQLIDVDFNADSIINQYLIKWQLTPSVPLTQERHDKFFIPDGQWNESTTYILMATVSMKEQSTIPPTEFTYVFQTHTEEDEWDEIFGVQFDAWEDESNYETQGQKVSAPVEVEEDVIIEEPDQEVSTEVDEDTAAPAESQKTGVTEEPAADQKEGQAATTEEESTINSIPAQDMTLSEPDQNEKSSSGDTSFTSEEDWSEIYAEETPHNEIEDHAFFEDSSSQDDTESAPSATDGSRRLNQKSVATLLSEIKSNDNSREYYASAVYYYQEDLLEAYATDPDSKSMLEAFDLLMQLTQQHKTDASLLIPLLGAVCAHAHLSNDQALLDVLMEKLLILPYDMSFKAGSGFAVASQVFNHRSTGQEESLRALDAFVMFNGEEIYNQLPTAPVTDLYFRLFCVLNLELEPVTYMQVVDSSSGQVYQMEDLSGQARIQFKISRENFVYGQSVCQVYGWLKSESEPESWHSELCETNVNLTESKVSCVCNVMSGSKVGLIRDSTLNEIPVEEATDVSKVDEHSKETRLMTLFLVVSVLFVTLMLGLGQCIAITMDNIDQKTQGEYSNQTALMIRAVAQELNQTVEHVQTRASEIQIYMGNSNLYILLAAALHPLTSPFSVQSQVQSRYLRYMSWQFFIVLFMVQCICYLNLLDHIDEVQLQYWEIIITIDEIFLGALLLLPTMRNSVLWCLGDYFDVKLNRIVQPKCILVRKPFYYVVNMMNFLAPVIATLFCNLNGGKAELMAAISIVFGLLLGIFGTCAFTVAVQLFLPRSLFCLKDKRAQQIEQDYNAVRKCMQNPNINKRSEVAMTERDFQTEMTEEPPQAPPPRVLKPLEELKASYSTVMEQAPESARNDAEAEL